MKQTAHPPPEAAPEPVITDDGDADSSGLDEKDIAMVIEQTNVSRARAIHALREADGDLVTAVMNLNL
jgi:nascent polypeptide-associated complex subunit alpha